MTTFRLLASSAGIALWAASAQADFTLTILHTNDFHDRWEPINAYDSTCSEEEAAANECFGGIARLVTAVTDARARDTNPLFLNAGDHFQGSLFYTQYKGATAAEFIPKVGYDALTLGNHEFDDGPAGLAPLLDALVAAGIPVVSANVDASREPLLAGKFTKSAVVEVGGQKIGIVGLTTTETPEIATPGPNVNFLPYDAAQEEIDALTAQGIDKIIVVSHVGYVEDQRLAAQLKDVDVIVGGHSHTLLSNTEEGAAGPYPTMVNGVPIVTARSYGKYLGELTVTFDDAGKVVSAKGDPILLDASVAEDEATKARVAELAAPLNELRNEVVGETSAPIDGERESCRAVECEMGNLVAEAMLDRVRDQGVTIALENGGGLRASIDAGPVTMGEVLTVLPFQNTLSTFQTDGATIVAALENGASQIEDGAGRFAQVAGLKYAIDLGKPAGSRVSDVQVLLGGDAWAPIDPAATYLVVTNNYVRTGGDGFEMFIDAKDAYDFGPDLADVTAEYLSRNQPYAPFTDGRITVTGTAAPPAAEETAAPATGDAAAAPAAEGTTAPAADAGTGTTGDAGTGTAPAEGSAATDAAAAPATEGTKAPAEATSP